MSIYISKNNQQQGPFEEAAVLEWLRTGQLSPNDLACRTGSNEWQRLEVLFPNASVPQTGNNPLAMALLQEVTTQIENSPISDVIARRFDVKEGYDPRLESFCKEMIAQCDRAEQSAPNDPNVLRTSLMLKAQLYGNWQKMSGMRGTQKSAVECYERALQLGNSPEMEADLRYRYGLLCSVAVAGVGGGKDKAVANFQRAIDLVGAESELGRAAANEMSGAKSSGGCLGSIAFASFVILLCISILLLKI